MDVKATPFLSQAAARILIPLTLNPGRIFFQRELERITDESLRGIQQSLMRLVRDSVVDSVTVGGRPGYRINRSNMFYPELVSISLKSIGIPELLDEGGVRALKVAIIGSFANGEFGDSSDIDVLVIGDEPTSGGADAALRKTSAVIGRELSTIVIGSEQYRDERDRQSGFIGSVLGEPFILLRGEL
jgi:hypothetical protein